MGIVSVVLFIFAPLTVGPRGARTSMPRTRELYIDLFRVMCFTQVLFAGSMALGEVLIAERRFFFYGAAPLLYNLGIVIGTVLLVDEIGIFAPAVGAILGAFDAPRHPAGRHHPHDLPAVASAAPADGRDPGVLPAAAAEGGRAARSIRLLFIFFTSLASTMATGSVTVVDQARNFQSLPVSLIGVTFALAAFPVLAVRYAAHDRRGFHRDRRPQRPHDRHPDRGSRDRPDRAGPLRHRGPARRWRVRPRRRRADFRKPRGVRPVRPVREPGAPVEPGDLRHAPHPAGRSERPSSGSCVTVATALVLAPSLEVLAIPLVVHARERHAMRPAGRGPRPAHPADADGADGARTRRRRSPDRPL